MCVMCAEMKEGMMTLLRMHNADELRFFTQNFGFADDLSKEDRIAKLDADVLIDEVCVVVCPSVAVLAQSCHAATDSALMCLQQPQYHRALSLIWEGIVIEYWRSLGKGIKNYRFDLKHMVWTWWLRGRCVVVSWGSRPLACGPRHSLRSLAAPTLSLPGMSWSWTRMSGRPSTHPWRSGRTG